MQPDGQYLVAGDARTTTVTTTSSYEFAIARVNSSNGSLDTSFNHDGLVPRLAPPGQPPQPPLAPGLEAGLAGLVTVPAILETTPNTNNVPGDPDFIHMAAIALQPTGKLVAAGYQDLETTNPEYLLARYETGLVVSSINGPATVNEGGTYTLNLSSPDPTTTQWTINWGDSVQVLVGNPSTATHVYADGPHNYTISATITTGTGTFAVNNTQAVTVLNVAPTLTLSGASTVNEGATYTLGLASSDPGPDTINHWTINWGDGPAQTVAGNPSSVTHVYADGPNNYTISATATDEDGTYAAGNTVAVGVGNVSPTLVISGAASVNEGATYTLSLSSSDPGTDTISQWSINWGDGAPQIVAGNPSSCDACLRRRRE